MAVIKEREPDTTVIDDSGPGAFIAVVFGLIVVAVIGYMIYAFNRNAPVVSPDMNAPQTQAPLSPPQAPAPGPSPAGQ